jgi:hypothetical protein
MQLLCLYSIWSSFIFVLNVFLPYSTLLLDATGFFDIPPIVSLILIVSSMQHSILQCIVLIVQLWFCFPPWRTACLCLLTRR